MNGKIVALFLLLSVPAVAQKTAVLHIAVLADVQIGLGSDLADSLRNMTIVDSIQAGRNGYAFNATVICGDISENGESEPNQYWIAKNVFENRLDSAFLYIPGNHDHYSVWNTSGGAFTVGRTILPYPPTDATAGDDSSWVWALNGWTFYGMDTGCTFSDCDQSLKLDQLSAWYYHTESYGDNYGFLVCHHNPRPVGGDEGTDAIYNHIAFMDSLNASWTNIKISAHGHRHYWWRDNITNGAYQVATASAGHTVNHIQVGRSEFGAGNLDHQFIDLTLYSDGTYKREVVRFN